MSEPIYPQTFTWSGEAMVPLNPKLADKQYVVGEVYRLEPREDRSQASHNHFFAAVAEAHANLPEHLAEQFPTPYHLRAFALIKGGFCDQRSIAVATAAEAQQLAAFMKPLDSYAIITATKNVVTIFTAKSQSMKAMGKADFEASKKAVLEVVAQMIGSNADTLQRNAGAAA